MRCAPLRNGIASSGEATRYIPRMACSWERVKLGRTGLSVAPIGLGSSYGLEERDVERAHERGLNYLYWGSVRRPAFGRAMRRLCARDRGSVCTVIQTYARVGVLVRPALERALRSLKIDYTDVFLLGWWNQPPPRRILDAALALRDAGKARHLMISCHARTTFARYAADPTYGAIMVRYNAAHPGAEAEVFPALGDGDRAARPGVIAYTATRWGQLPDPRCTPPGERTPRGSDCYRFALSHPSVDLCLAGPKDAAELDDAMAALDRGPMSADELAWMRRVGAAIHASPRAGRVSPMAILDGLAGLFSRESRS
jgi:aryl-alcohol dehydrogenase-like predicted oxidoreductase